MTDGLYIDIYVALQKMFRLRIKGAPQHFLNKNLSPTGRSIEPKKDTQHDEKRQESRCGVETFLCRTSDGAASWVTREQI